MVQINFAQKQVNAKIVYYGPGMSGKTTNLEIVHQRAPAPNRGDLTSISTDGDRTLFFDFMPLDLGTVAGMRTCFQIYTVPGQVYYNSTRKLVLQGVDGVVFVADSSAAMIEENLESMRNLEQNLAEYGKSLATIPLIIQYNKRDLPDAMPVDDLNRHLNPYGAPCFEAIANSGQGVFPTLKALAARVLETIHTGAKTQGSASVSSGQTGYFAGAGMTAQPGAPRALQQTGYHTAQQVGHSPVAPPVAPRALPASAPAAHQAPPIAAQAPGLAPAHPTHAQSAQGLQMQGTFDPLARTAVHPPPAITMPPMPQPVAMPAQPTMTGVPLHAPQAPPMAPAMQSPPGHPAYGHLAPQPAPVPVRAAATPQAEAVPTATMPGQQQAQAQSASLHMMRLEKAAHGPTPGMPARTRALPAPRAPAAPQPAQRIQPRAAPMPTPGKSGNKRMVYVGLFLVVALGVGAVIAKIVLKVF